MKKKKIFWLPLVTNFNTFVVEVEEGKKKAKIYDEDNPETIFNVKILGESFPCMSTFGVVNTSKKLVSEVALEDHLKAMEQRNDYAVVIQLHDEGDKILIVKAKIKQKQ